MTEDKTISGNLYGVPVTVTFKGKPDPYRDGESSE